MSEITQDKLRDGDPTALAVLCARRGPAVYAYCEQVAGNERALVATCDAFAWFRVAVAATGSVKARDAEALLRGMTRRAATAGGIQTAARQDSGPRDRACADCEMRLVYYIENGVSDEEREQIAAHMADCRACVEALHRLEAGEGAYDQPVVASLALPVAEAVLDDLIAASPVRAHGGDVGRVRAAALGMLNGDGQNGAPVGRPTARAGARARGQEPPPGSPRPQRGAAPARGQQRATAGARAPAARSAERQRRAPPSRADRRTTPASKQRPTGELSLASLRRVLPVAMHRVRRWRYKTALSQRRRPRWYNGRGAAWWVVCALLVIVLGLVLVVAVSSAHAAASGSAAVARRAAQPAGAARSAGNRVPGAVIRGQPHAPTTR